MTAEPAAARPLPSPGVAVAEFPIGAFSYSHGLEAASPRRVCDAASLQGWVAAIIAQGSGRIDADILVEAYRTAEAGICGARRRQPPRPRLPGTAELALEAAQQGEAFSIPAAPPGRAAFEAWASPAITLTLPASGGGRGGLALKRQGSATSYKVGDRGKYPAHPDPSLRKPPP